MISKWAYFLNLDKDFQRFYCILLHFTVPKKECFVDKGNFILGMAPKTELLMVFFIVLWG